MCQTIVGETGAATSRIESLIALAPQLQHLAVAIMHRVEKGILMIILQARPYRNKKHVIPAMLTSLCSITPLSDESVYNETKFRYQHR
jgi:hypothetical protein